MKTNEPVALVPKDPFPEVKQSSEANQFIINLDITAPTRITETNQQFIQEPKAPHSRTRTGKRLAVTFKKASR